MAEDYQGNLDELVRHNGNLVRTAQALQVQLQAAVRVCAHVVAVADPVPGNLHGEPQLYLVPVEEIEELRAVCTLATVWGFVDL